MPTHDPTTNPHPGDVVEARWGRKWCRRTVVEVFRAGDKWPRLKDTTCDGIRVVYDNRNGNRTTTTLEKWRKRKMRVPPAAKEKPMPPEVQSAFAITCIACNRPAEKGEHVLPLGRISDAGIDLLPGNCLHVKCLLALVMAGGGCHYHRPYELMDRIRDFLHAEKESQ